MAGTLENVINHITSTLRSPPAATLARYPTRRAGGLRHADSRSGRRFEIEQMVGQSRIFEVDLEQRSVSPVMLGNAVPSGYTATVPVLGRYQSKGPQDRHRMLLDIVSDQEFMVDALSASNWSGVTKLVSLIAEVGGVRRFELVDDVNGKEYEGFLSEVVVTASYDT